MLYFFGYCWSAFKGWAWSYSPLAYGFRLSHFLAIGSHVTTHLQNVEMAFDVVRSKTYEMPYSGKEFLFNLAVGVYFTGLTTYLQWASPNQLAYDPTDGGRAMLYILMFGTAILVLQMQIGHLTKKVFNPFKSIPFVLTNLILTFFAIGL